MRRGGVARATAALLLLLLHTSASSPAAASGAAGEPQRARQHQRRPGAAAGAGHLVRDQRKLQPGVFLQAAAQRIASGQRAAAAAGPNAAAAASGPECSRDYGEQYVTRWRALQGTFCSSSNTTAAAHGVQSSVACHAHPEADLSTCVLRNLLLRSTSGFIGSSPGPSELPQSRRGSIQLACTASAPAASFLRGRLHSNEGSRAWLETAPAFGPADTLMQHSCSADHAVAHPVLLLLRVDPQNAFHNLETIVSVFAALAVLQLPPPQLQLGLQVVIADDRQAGYFMDVWRRLSWPHPVRVLRQQPYPDDTCFATALLAPYTAHAQSLLTYKAGSADEVTCESAVLQAAAAWLRHLFRDLLPPEPGAQQQQQQPTDVGGATSSSAPASAAADAPAAAAAAAAATGARAAVLPGRPWSRLHGHGGYAPLDLAPLSPSPVQSSSAPLELLHVVWLSRRRYEQQHAAGLTDWQKARALPADQQEALLAELQRAVLRWNEATCAAPGQRGCVDRAVLFSLQVAELSELSFYPQQLGLMMRTGVLAGVHGAGLANQVFMAPRLGAVVEVWHGMEGNTHYHNLAHGLGHAYANVKTGEGGADLGDADVRAIADAVTRAMDEVADRRGRQQQRQRRRQRRHGPWWWRHRSA